MTACSTRLKTMTSNSSGWTNQQATTNATSTRKATGAATKSKFSEINAMTAKCLFCKDTKIEPGIPGPCVWCEEIGPATTGAVERFTIATLRYAGGSEHDVRYVSEVHYDAALAELRALLDKDVDRPECSGNPESCPENEGFGCCKENTCIAPSGDICPGDGVGKCKKCPAAQHQGEPVALDENQSFAKWMHETVEFTHHGDKVSKIQRRDIVEPSEEKWAFEAWKGRAKLAEQPAPVAVVIPERDALRDLLAGAIGGDTYDCTRVWSAWGVGTMSEDDFVPVVEQDARLYEIADSFLAEVAKLNGVKS